MDVFKIMGYLTGSHSNFTRVWTVSKLRNFLIVLILNMWKKAALHVWFICLTIFNWLSNQPPRFLTSEEGRIAVWPTQRGSMSTFTNCCLVPITVNSVFSSLSISLSISIHFPILVMHACIAATALVACSGSSLKVI